MRPVPGIGEETPEPNEKETIETVTKIMRAAATFTSALGPLRVPHVKSHGCVDATFIVNDDLPAEYAVGIFRKDEHGNGRSYPARIRFSNASSKQQDDREGDGRGMAIKLFVPGNPPKEQDFLLATEKVFFARNGKDFLAFVDALTKFNGREKLKETHPHIDEIIKKSQNTLRPPNPLAMEYFSQVPYRFGPGRAVKYSAKPSSQPPVLDVTGTLADAMVKHLSMQGATFDFQVQLQTDPVTMPIEDSTVEWPEDPASKGSPFKTVATIRIERGPVGNCESLAFDPWHSFRDHEPLGIINRIRHQVYRAAAERRLLPKTQNQLTAVMTIKEPVPEKIKELRTLLQENSLANGLKLHRLGFVHSARFLIIGDKFAIITSFDFDFRDYINTFVDELGDLFDQVLKVMQDAPPSPVREHRDEFVAYIERIRIQPVLFYAEYPELSVQNVLTMKEAWEKQQ
jgi:hypothetical protein